MLNNRFITDRTLTFGINFKDFRTITASFNDSRLAPGANGVPANAIIAHISNEDVMEVFFSRVIEFFKFIDRCGRQGFFVTWEILREM